LNKAIDILKDETIKLISELRHVTHAQAEKIMYTSWNCPIAEVVNGVQDVYCIVTKQANTSTPALTKTDNDKFFVTYGKDSDAENAMKIASMAMIKKFRKKSISPLKMFMYSQAS
jgi:hypothetical protein